MKRIMKRERIIFFFFVILLLKSVLVSFYAGAEIVEPKRDGSNETEGSNCVEDLKLALVKEREVLEGANREILARKSELLVMEKKTQEQIAALKELIQNAEAKIQELKGTQDERFKLLVKSYSEMRPSKAAQLLINMDREMAAKILGQLKSSQVASILSAMPPDKAASLAEAISGYPPREY